MNEIEINIFIIYEIDSWSINPSNNFQIKKNCLFLAAKLTRHAIKIISNGYGIVFDGAGS